MDAIRSFIALELTPEIKSTALKLSDRLRKAGAEVRWVEDEQMHITLNFLGDVPSVAIPAVCEAMARAAGAMPAFDMVVRGAGAFPRNDRPRTIWLGVEEGSEELIELQRAVGMELDKIGIYTDRKKFRPHITLGRVRGGKSMEALAELLEANADFSAAAMQVAEIVMISSFLERRGPIYDVMGRADLGEE
ncbi:RNA 2',3'-cyclic phosphodiesterase [Lignipirellula cremea]|uniref:RNA 2',3'-cyclic phosphodiesterase n=1 Tax=Lignipirellula cremea TaxID=2528010 RepID=A0A518E0Z8_9BACT|nr:RNA 2',3'-cyclic phosphodiesterase [Lignipirellula cremea]QDU97752.1 2'-5'-RNA ligase [Lignipirellula cremea]